MTLRRLAALTLLLAAQPPVAFAAGAIRDLPGFSANALFRCDDSDPDEFRFVDQCTADRNVPQAIGFTIDFFGVEASTLFVNNNGNVTLGEPLFEYRPFPLESTERRIIAPFFADVDTRDLDSGVVTYGTALVDGRNAFGVNWIDVGYYASHAAPANSFQLVLVERADVGPGDFDIEFNYDHIGWEAGDDDGGDGGLAVQAGTAARVGFSNGLVSFELPGSGTPGAFLDSSGTGLAVASFGSTQPGRYVFRVRNGQVLTCTDAAICDDADTCTAEACVLRPGEPLGECQYPAVNEGLPCDDHDTCTEKDLCAAGRCAGRPRDCDDGDGCTEDFCDPSLGGCSYAAIADGEPCDDSDGCTDASVCRDATCSAADRSCELDTIPAGTTQRRKPFVKVLCSGALPGSQCRADLVEAVVASGVVPAAVLGEDAVGVATDSSVAPTFRGVEAGRIFAPARSKAVDAKGRAKLKLKLNAEGRRLLKAAPRTQGVLAILNVAVVEPSQRERGVQRLLQFLRKGR